MLKNREKLFSFKWWLAWGTLFGLTLCVSIMYHLPVGWLLSQPSIQKQWPDSVVLNSSSGTIWHGRTQVSLSEPIGQIAWDLSFWALLMGRLDVEAQWQKEQSQLSAELNVPLRLEVDTLNVTHLNGSLELPMLIQLLNAPGLNDLPIEGKLELKHVDLSMNFQTQWPSVFTGTLVLNHLSVLGNIFPKILITPKLKEDQLTFHIEGGESGWRLSGQLDVFKSRQYVMALTVNAQSPESMPGWAGLLRQQSPTVAVLNNRGHW